MCRQRTSTKMNLYTSRFLLTTLCSPLTLDLWPCCGPSRPHMVPLWPLVAPLPRLVSLSFIPLPPAGQMFIYNAADKEKASHSHSLSHSSRLEQTEREVTAIICRFTLVPVIRDSGQCDGVVTAFDGQGDGTCGLQCTYL